MKIAPLPRARRRILSAIFDVLKHFLSKTILEIYIYNGIISLYDYNTEEFDMRKVLSLILASALIISLTPAAFAADKAETISYKISSDSISTAQVDPSAHFIPVETDEASENYGDLKIELRTFTTSNSTTTYETTGYKYAEPTFKNLIMNFDGDFTGLSTSFSNNELGMLSYRSLDYWRYVSGANGTIKKYWPFRKLLNSTVSLSEMKFGNSWGILYVDGSPDEYTLPPTLDLSKTAPFELYGKGLLSSHAWLDNKGYYGSFYIGSESDPDANFSTFGSISGPNFPVRIKIPEDAVAGKYTLRVGSDRTNGYGIYGDNNASRTFVYMTKIDSEKGFEGLFDGKSAKGGLFAGFADGNGNALDRSAYAAEANLFGTYTCLNGTSTSFEKEIDVAPGEEYIIYFEIDGSAIDKTELNNKEWDKATVYDHNKYIYQSFKLSYIDLVPVVEDDEDYVRDFDAEEETYVTGGTGTVNAYTFTDKEESFSLGNTVSLGESVALEAPEKEGYKFLYWAKGASNSKQVIAYNEEITYKPSEGANYIVAVYEKEGSEANRAEFYNANGSLVKALDADGAAPELPSMAGFGNASGWQLYGTDEVIAAGSAVTVAGTKIYVAKYPETPGKVKVNGVEYTYGETVTMPEIDTTKIFKGWKRNGGIVSVDPSYTFRAWEDTTVEAVYAESAPAFSGKFMKIVIDSFEAGNETAVMAEFIGIDNAVEKGIIINGTKKIAMKGNGNQFSVIADIPNATYIGYAILRDGDGFIEVTDGNE